ncbi:AMP-dependent synthetase and ligase, partial [mine drainage metagenome]
ADNERSPFWEAVVKDCEISFFEKYSSILDDSEGKPWTKWFVGGKINLSYNCVEKYKNTDTPAIICEFEDRSTETISFRELDRKTGQLSAFLKNLGVVKGDKIGIFMPLIPEAIVAMYSIMRIGAVAVPMFSGYGKEAVETRVEDASIKYLFTVDSYNRKGKEIKMADSARGIEGLTLIIKGSTHP